MMLFQDNIRQAELKKNRFVVISVKLKAGEDIVLYHSGNQGSSPNFAMHDRVAAGCSVIREEAPFCIYFQSHEEDALKQYEQEDDFALQYDNLRAKASIRPPSLHSVSSYPLYGNTPVELKELTSFIKSKKTLFNFRKA